MKNTLILNGVEYHERFFRSIMNNSIKELQNLKNDIINKYSKNIEGFSLKNFNADLLRFPNF